MGYMTTVVRSMKKSGLLRGPVYGWRFLARGSYDDLDEKQRQAAVFLDQNPHLRWHVVADNPDFQGRTKSDHELACEAKSPVRRMPDEDPMCDPWWRSRKAKQDQQVMGICGKKRGHDQ